MSSDPRDLRPYYDSEAFNTGYPTIFRPGIGVVDENGNTIASKISRTSVASLNFSTQGSGKVGIGSKFGFQGSNRTLRNMAKVKDYNENIQKNMVSDLEFSEYFDLNNIGELLKSLINSFVRNYIRCLVSQPFEVARLLLQVGDFQTLKSTALNLSGGSGPGSSSGLSSSSKKRIQFDEFTEQEKNEKNSNDDAMDIYDTYDDEDDDDELNYFQPINPTESEIIHSKTRTIKKKTIKPKKFKSSSEAVKEVRCKHYLKPVSLNTVDVMSTLLTAEGLRGLWRGSNITFITNALSSTLEAWITGFVSPFLQIPDPFFVDVTHSSDPSTTLILSLSASVLTGLLLAPLDLIRTKMIVTTINKNERSIRNSIYNLKFYTIPISLILPTILNSLSNNFFKKFTPYLLYVKFGIDSISSPALFSTVKLLSSILELFIKLPIETLLRRSQVHYLLKNAKSSSNPLKISGQEKLVVKFDGYNGIWKTLFNVYHNKNSENKGFEGLFRGWRVGVVSIVGSWGLHILQDQNYNDQIFREEKF